MMRDESKLPKWAQDLIKDLRRQAEVSKAKLDKYLDEDTPDRFFQADIICNENPPRFVKRHIQGRGISCHHAGIELDILCRDGEIDLNYSAGGLPVSDVILQPYSFNALRLKVPNETS